MTTPKQQGFIMPGEFSPHEGTIMIFPTREGSWTKSPKKAQQTFGKIASEIAQRERMIMLVCPQDEHLARTMLPPTVELQTIPSNDAWARDNCPTFIQKGKQVCAIDWKFNAWGGDFDGLYLDYAEDDAIPPLFAQKNGYPLIDAHPFVLEGGSIHSDGEGTLLVTEACLLSKGRNPHLSKQEIEDTLKNYLGAEKVIWLPHGIFNDETNEHVDNVCAFIRPAEVVLAWTDNENDPQYAYSKADYDLLSKECDAKGRPFIIHKLPIPDHPILVTEEDVQSFIFAEGEDNREVGERLAASYVNFYFCNGAILLPQFGGENTPSDQRAVAIMQRLCPNHTIIPIDSLVILKGGGNIHCITQQIPKGE